MEVVVLAGGLGTRLRSVVSEVPKCMASVLNKPFLHYLLRYISKYEVSKVILSVGYLKEVIFNWIDEVKSEFTFEIVFAVEEEPLGTGGGIAFAMQDVVGDNCVVLNGDTFLDVDLDDLMQNHVNLKSKVTVALKEMTCFSRYGNVIYNSDNVIQSFIEKKYTEKGHINAGVYVINKDYLNQITSKEKFSFEEEVLTPGAKRNDLYGYVTDGYFIDIGIPEDYNKAQIDFKTVFDEL